MDLLITSLLDYARLQAQHLPLDLQSVDLRQVLESVADLLEPHYRAKQQTLDLQLPSGPIAVLGDPFRLKSAAQALLETACKRSPEQGKLSMGCRTHMGGALGWVCDTGPCVPEEARTDIFTQAYWQTMEDSPSLTAFGLGLPLAHGLITLHGGRLWLADPEMVDEGICFHFSLPLASA
jgi:signal transduction histidine kinase